MSEAFIKIDLHGMRREEAYTPQMVTDVGSWDLTFSDKDGNKVELSDSLYPDNMVLDHDDLSSRIRRYLGLDDLFVFDGDARTTIKTKEGEYIFANVLFESGERTYCYISNDPDIREADEAIVPVGDDGKTDRVYIKSVEVHKAEDAPYPVEKCKHIIQVIKF